VAGPSPGCSDRRQWADDPDRLRETGLPGPPVDGSWWKREPIRFLQTNLSETDSTVDPRLLVAAVADVGANTFLMNMGGIAAST
jgi:hypothetical protein